MSVFRGSIVEYPGVVVDHYIPANCERGRIFFLSHCHKDHMTGLGSRALLDALRTRCTFLHCSEVTRALLLHYTEFRDLIPFLKALPMEEPVSVKLEPTLDASEMNLTVTLLPAGHCPGSAMFLIQGGNGTVLYTGDFRLTVDEVKRIQSLHPGGRLMSITTLYLDTTFCTPISSDIPDRETSRQFILSCITDWLARSPQNAVLLQCSMFGYEHVFMGVSQKLCTKVHVGSWRHNVYSEIPAVHECLTVDGQSTRVHCCSYRKGQQRTSGLPCGSKGPNGRPFHLLTIKPSTQWFLSLNRSTGSCPCVFLSKQNMYRVMHSMHASFSEICSFAAYIRPRQIVPCVVPSGDSALTDVHARLKVFLSGSLKQHLPSETDNQETVVDVICRGEEEGECSSESDPEWLAQREEDIDDNDGVQKRDSLPLGLPSMLIGDREGHSPTSSSSIDGQDSVGTGGTVGSLEQTPIDLYLSCDSTPSQGTESLVPACSGDNVEEDSVNTTGCDHPDGSSSKLDIPAANTNASSGKVQVPTDDDPSASLGKPDDDDPSASLGKPDDDDSSASLGKPVIPADDTNKAIDIKDDTTYTGPQSLALNLTRATSGAKEHYLDLCAEDEEVVLLEQPYHRQRRHSSVEVRCEDSKDLEPHGKRLRLSCPGSSEIPMCPLYSDPYFHTSSSVASSSGIQSCGVSQPPVDYQLCPSLLSNIRTAKAIVFIDLTKDDDAYEFNESDVLCKGAKDESDHDKDDHDENDHKEDDHKKDDHKEDDHKEDDHNEDNHDENDHKEDDHKEADNKEDDIIVLSGSSSISARELEEDNLSDDGLPSPEFLGYLPPSPGREEASSILKRKALGF